MDLDDAHSLEELRARQPKDLQASRVVLVVEFVELGVVDDGFPSVGRDIHEESDFSFERGKVESVTRQKLNLKQKQKPHTHIDKRAAQV